MSLTRPSPRTDGSEPLSSAVVSAIARHEGVDPVHLDPPLYEYIDPDALDSLFRDGDESTVELTFRYDGCVVRVDSDGIRITPRDHPPAPGV